VYRVHLASVYAFCLSQLRNATDAEDVTGEVFASAFAAYQRSEVDQHQVVPWLFRIARNALIDHYRRDRRRHLTQQLLQRADGRDACVDVEREVEIRDELRYVLNRMQRLKLRDRILVGLRVAAHQSYAEIGAVLGISEHAATVATHRAQERLRALCEAGR
jgi:RNA polymerase sigma-70 factor (ECF subfamily)